MKLKREWILCCQTRPSKRGGGTPSDSTVNSLIRPLKALCNWLKEEEFVDRILLARVKVPDLRRMIKPIRSSEEITAVLAAAPQQRNGLRDEFILLFIRDTGAQAGEACDLRADEIDWNAGVARLFGKGRKEMYIPFFVLTSKVM